MKTVLHSAGQTISGQFVKAVDVEKGIPYRPYEVMNSSRVKGYIINSTHGAQGSECCQTLTGAG